LGSLGHVSKGFIAGYAKCTSDGYGYHTENVKQEAYLVACVATESKLHAKCRFDVFVISSTLFKFDVLETCPKTSE
jgi:hypothetical protein